MHVKQRQSFDEDVFEACILRLFIDSSYQCISVRGWGLGGLQPPLPPVGKK